ncbi:MAG: SRPBCC domain-containing protein [Proteobacteria bacterium]|nr:SRPBCC domain-containing protein [Pseudomonadota bacterium]
MCLMVKTEITIKQDPQKVWEVLTHFQAYPQWNPFITRVEQVDDKNLLIEITSGRSKTIFKPVILQINPPKELRWRGKLGGVSGLFTGEHYFILSKEGKNTRFIQGEVFSGILAILLWPFIRKTIHSNFERMNEALKTIAER